MGPDFILLVISTYSWGFIMKSALGLHLDGVEVASDTDWREVRFIMKSAPSNRLGRVRDHVPAGVVLANFVGRPGHWALALRAGIPSAAVGATLLRTSQPSELRQH